jgi:magnesium transporter
VSSGAAPVPRHVLDTAAEHVARRVPCASPSELAGDVRRALAGQRYESADTIAVLEDGRLGGLVEIEALLAADEDTPIGSLVAAEPTVVHPGVDQERAVHHLVRSGASSLAVVDEHGAFLGLIPPGRMLAVLVEEHDEDLARLGGFLSSTESARSAAEEPVGRRFWHRIPWLLLGLAGAAVAAAIVGSFEDELEEEVLLAFFVPSVVYMADAVGTQTEAVVIRGLAVGVAPGRVVVRELVTGLLVGAAIGAAFMPLAWVVWGSGEVAVAVALALLASCSVATLVAMGLPFLLHRLGRDPAFGSGPLATVIQDLLSIVIYFAVTVPIVL